MFKINFVKDVFEKTANYIIKRSSYTNLFYKGENLPIYDNNSQIEVNQNSMFNISAFFSAVKIISEDISSMPINLYKKIGKTSRELDDTNYLFYLLKNECNSDGMLGMELIETVVINMLLWGAGYIQIIRTKSGRINELYPLISARMSIEQDGSKIKYIYTDLDNNQIEMNKNNFINIPMFSVDGIHGKSIINCARESMQLTHNAEEFGRSFFKNGARLSGTVEMEANQKLKDKDKTEKEFQRKFSGASNAGKVLVLEGGMKYKSIGIPPEDAQFLQTRQFQLSEVARWFRIPPHKLGDLSRATFSNIEQQNIDYVSCLNPITRKIQKRLSSSLLKDYTRYYEFDSSELLKGDLESRYKSYASAINSGFMSPNDARKSEKMNSIPDGDELIVNGNMIPLSQVKNNFENKKNNKNISDKKGLDEQNNDNDDKEV